MLKLIRFYCDLDLNQLQCVYAEGLLNPSFSAEEERLAVENFNADATDFLNQQQGVYAVWIVDQQYKAALRLEKFKNGYLIAGLETMPLQRNRGYASSLLCSLKDLYTDLGHPLYSHVKKTNTVSLRVHLKCGFIQLNDCAVLLDGTVSNQYYTLSTSK